MGDESGRTTTYVRVVLHIIDNPAACVGQGASLDEAIENFIETFDPKIL